MNSDIIQPVLVVFMFFVLPVAKQRSQSVIFTNLIHHDAEQIEEDLKALWPFFFPIKT